MAIDCLIPLGIIPNVGSTKFVLCFEAFCFQYVTNLCNTFCQFDLEYLQSLSLMLVESQVSLVTTAGLNGSVLL